MPRMSPGNKDRKSLINKDTLLDIVKNYQIQNLTIKEDDENGISHISFTSLPASQQEGMDAAMQHREEMSGIENNLEEDMAENQMDIIEEEPMHLGSSSKVVVRIAKDFTKKVTKKQTIENSLVQKYPLKYLKNLGIIKE